MDEAVARELAALRAIVDRQAEDERRHHAEVVEQIRSTASALVGLEGRIGELETMQPAIIAGSEAARVLADGAKVAATRSLSEITSIGDDVKRSVLRLETSRKEAEVARVNGAAAHAKRFDEQGEAIREIQANLARQTSRTDREKWLVGGLIAIVTVLGNQAVEAIKIIYAPPPPVLSVTREVPR